MKHFIKNILFSYIVPIALAASMSVIVSSYNTLKSSTMQLCSHPYALCTSAKCVPDPGNPSQAICFCDVEEGKSMATVPCDTLRPSTDSSGIRTIYSTFSLVQYEAGKKAMYCPDGTPWCQCLNKQCTVYPTNPRKALCICDVMNTGNWTTAGGCCNTSTCATAFWSGALDTDAVKGRAFLVKALGLKKSPVKSCPCQKQFVHSDSL